MTFDGDVSEMNVNELARLLEEAREELEYYKWHAKEAGRRCVREIDYLTVIFNQYRNSEQALKLKNMELLSFINNIPDMAWLKDADSRFIVANKAFGNAVEMDPETLINQSCDICFGNEAATKFREDDLRVMKSGKQDIIEEKILDGHGNEIWLETIKSPIISESGELIGTVGIARDITVRKKTEEALKLSEMELQKQKAALEQKNIALSEIIGQIEDQKNKIKNDMIININNLIIPVLDRLKLNNPSNEYIDILHTLFERITSSFGRKITSTNIKLTQREIEICTMVLKGLTNKEISKLLNIACHTVEKHRGNIRSKLGIKREINLASYLQQI